MFRVSKIDDGGRAFQGHETHASEPKLEKKCVHIMAAFWRPLTEFSLWWGPENGRYFFPGFEPGANFLETAP